MSFALLLSFSGLLLTGKLSQAENPSQVGNNVVNSDVVTTAVVVNPGLKEFQKVVNDYCLDCHSSTESQGGMDLEKLSFSADQFNSAGLKIAHWEKILRRLNTRQMPPVGSARPDDKAYVSASSTINGLLKNHYEKHPAPGRVNSIRRMTRMEYKYAIRDLLGVEVDIESFLPNDESSHGFDNITVDDLSPTHLNRYISAAQKISQVAMGGGGEGSLGVTIRMPPDQSQEEHIAGMPFGTRGGMLIKQYFPDTGEYEIELKLSRDRDEKIEGLKGSYDIDILLNREKVHSFKVGPSKKGSDWEKGENKSPDGHLHVRLKIPAGTHELIATFPKTSSALSENKRQPFDTSYNRHRHPRRTPAIYQVSIVGPFASEDTSLATSKNDASNNDANKNIVSETKPRQLIMGEFLHEKNLGEGDIRKLIARLAYRAYRRIINQEDIELLMSFYQAARAEGQNQDQGIERTLAAILVNPHFLLRVEGSGVPNPEADKAGVTHGKNGQHGIEPVNDYELAARLSYFIWSSIPDEELLKLASEKQLHREEVLTQQVERMLSDVKSLALVDNFAAQWLYLRNLNSMSPDLRLFPDFDDNLRQAFQQETKLLFEDVLRHDRSVLGLISSNYTYINERLAKHYGITNVTGSHFRRVEVTPESQRGGILRHGSILMVTSYATRTSPTIRGKWVLENIYGTPPPPPPANVPNIKEEGITKASTLRERLAMHRANKACAACHDLIDPVGFALENFDAVGRLRTFDGTLAIDSRGNLPDGTQISTVAEVEKNILIRPEIFVQTVTERLMTYGLGRAVEPEDGSVVRGIVEAASHDEYRLRSIIKGIVLSPPFRMRSVVSP